MINRPAVFCLLISVFIFILIFFYSQQETNFSAKCIKVFDCKRIIVWLDNQLLYNRMKIRLNDVQCPERNTTMGKQAREYLKNQIYGKMIDIEIVNRRFWGWSDAVVYYNGVCLNRALKKKWK